MISKLCLLPKLHMCMLARSYCIIRDQSQLDKYLTINIQQIDVLPSKNQSLYTSYLLLKIHNDIMKKSHEQRLITYHIATHTHLYFMFKPAIYSSALLIKVLCSRSSFN